MVTEAAASCIDSTCVSGLLAVLVRAYLTGLPPNATPCPAVPYNRHPGNA